MVERLTGYDTTYFHFGDRSPMHTLKVLVLDHRRRGRAVTLEDVRAAVAPRLALHPRARQRAVRARHLPGRYTWFDDPEFDLDRHLDETTVDGPDGLDEVCGRLAGEHLHPDRPLWHATLVHGLGDTRQAIAFRVHHAVMDGVGAANTVRHFTTAEPGGAVPVAQSDRWDPAPVPDELGLCRHAVRAVPEWCRKAGIYAAETVRGRDERSADRRTVKARDDLIGLASEATYGWTGARFGSARSCASGSLPFRLAKRVKDEHGVTLNDVLVTVVGEAIVAEARARGESRPEDEIAMFNIALDTDPDRLHGNHIMAVTVPMHTRGDDLADRLQRVHRTCADQIAITRRGQDRRTVRITDLWGRSFALGARTFAYRIPTMVSNVVMANVALSPTTRWVGDVEVVDFVSYAVLVQPIGLNVTIYSYGDHLSVGLLTAPEVIDEPQRMIGRIAEALDRLAATSPASQALSAG